MKKLLFSVLALFLSAIAFTQTSVYHPFPDSDSYWRETSAGYQCYCCAWYQNILSGDTVINSITYQKITHSGRQFSSNPAGDCMFSGGYIPFINYNGAIRNDIPEKKVWIIPADSANEQLLYDFDLHLNDTLRPTFINRVAFYDPNLANIVSVVDSVLVGNEYHKSFGIALSTSPEGIYAWLIEGVGSTFGLFGSMGELVPPFEFGSMLECFSVNGLSVYPESAQECLLVSDVNEPLPLGNFTIYPNPMTETAVIVMPDDIQKADLHVFDVNGREVYIKNDVINHSVFERGNLPKGVYFYQFSIKGSIKSNGKLIVN